jgi:hypothetical protein
MKHQPQRWPIQHLKTYLEAAKAERLVEISEKRFAQFSEMWAHTKFFLSHLYNEAFRKAVVQINLRTWLGHTLFNIGFWTFFEELLSWHISLRAPPYAQAPSDFLSRITI